MRSPPIRGAMQTGWIGKRGDFLTNIIFVCIRNSSAQYTDLRRSYYLDTVVYVSRHKLNGYRKVLSLRWNTSATLTVDHSTLCPQPAPEIRRPNVEQRAN